MNPAPPVTRTDMVYKIRIRFNNLMMDDEEKQDKDEEKPLSKEDEEKVKERLRALGYID